MTAMTGRCRRHHQQSCEGPTDRGLCAKHATIWADMQADWERRAAAADAQARPPAPKPEPVPPRPAATSCRPWTDDEKDILWQYSLREAFDLLEDRTLWSIRQQRYRMGVVKAQWSPEEDAVLHTHGNTDAVRLLPHRTYYAIANRRKDIGAPAGIERPWTKREDTIIATHTLRNAKPLLKRSMKAIQERREQLGIGRVANGAWTPKEDHIVETMPTSKALLKLPGRTLYAIRCRRRRLAQKAQVAA